MERPKTWVATVATGHTSRGSLGVGVFVVPSGMWESEEVNVVHAGPEDFVGTEKRHVAECEFAGGMSAGCERPTWALYADLAYGMTAWAWERVGHMGRGQGLSCASDAIHTNVSVHWKWNQARKGGRRRKTGHVSAPVVKRRIRPKLRETWTHIDSISIIVYPHAVYDGVEATA